MNIIIKIQNPGIHRVVKTYILYTTKFFVTPHCYFILFRFNWCYSFCLKFFWGGNSHPLPLKLQKYTIRIDNLQYIFINFGD